MLKKSTWTQYIFQRGGTDRFEDELGQLGSCNHIEFKSNLSLLVFEATSDGSDAWLMYSTRVEFEDGSKFYCNNAGNLWMQKENANDCNNCYKYTIVCHRLACEYFFNPKNLSYQMKC